MAGGPMLRRRFLRDASLLALLMSPGAALAAQPAVKTEDSMISPDEHVAAPEKAANTTGNATIFFDSDVNIGSVANLTVGIQNALEKNAERISLIINGNGGDVKAGLAAYGFLRALPVPLTTVNVGEIDSMSISLYLAGDERISTPTSTFLLHAIRGHLTADWVYPAANVVEFVQSMEQNESRLEDIYRSRSMISAEQIQALRTRNLVLSAAEAQQAGIVTSIADIRMPRGGTIITINPVTNAY